MWSGVQMRDAGCRHISSAVIAQATNDGIRRHCRVTWGASRALASAGPATTISSLASTAASGLRRVTQDTST